MLRVFEPIAAGLEAVGAVDHKRARAVGRSIGGAVAGTLGTIQATEAVKYLAGFEDGLLTDRLLVYDAKNMKFREVEVKRDPNCASCGAAAGASANL